MKELKDLNRTQKLTLLAVCKANKGQLNARWSRAFIQRFFPEKSQLKYFRKALDKLVSNGFVGEKPSRRKRTYFLTKKGISACKVLKEDEEIIENGI